MTAASDWPALVLSAGLATRLQPLSDTRAKAALPVAGEALIVRILRSLHAAGVSRVVLNLHHQAHTITREVGDGSALGLDVRYSWEPSVLGSAGGPAHALSLLGADRFFVVNGDTLADVNLRALAARHVETNALVTMAVVNANPRYNAIIANESGIVTSFERCGAPGAGGSGAYHFIGVQAANAAAFAGVSTDVKSESVHGIYPQMIANRPGSLRVFPTSAEFFDIGTPWEYLSTALTVAAREGRPVDRGRGCVVAEDARLEATVLWNDVTIGAGAALTHCVVADGVRVPAGARYEHCSLVLTDEGVMATPFGVRTDS